MFAVCTGGGCSRCLLDHHRSFFLNTNWNKWDRLLFCISCIFFILIYFPYFISCIFLKYFSRIQIEINKTSCLCIVEDHAQNHKHTNSHNIKIPPHVISWSQRKSGDNGLWDVSRRWVRRGASSPLRAKHHLQAGPDFFGFRADSDFLLVFKQIQIFWFGWKWQKTQMMMYIVVSLPFFAFCLHVYVPQKVARYKINEGLRSYSAYL